VILKVIDDDGYEDVFSMKISIVFPPHHHINLFLVISFFNVNCCFYSSRKYNFLIKRCERRKMMEKEKEEIIDLITRIIRKE